MKAKDAIKEIKRQQQELAEKLKSLSTEAFSEDSKALFEKHPTLTSFSWTQYTPYFNDGDTCHFSVYSEEIDFIFGEAEYEYVGRWNVKQNIYEESTSTAMLDVLDFLREFNDEQMETLFGDHCKVSVSRDGTNVSGHDHD